MPIEIDDLIAKLEWTAQRGLSDFTMNSGGTRIRILRHGGLSPVPEHAQVQPQEPIARPAQTIDAPMSGICHLSAEFEATPFVKVGDTVTDGQTVCMLEAMKMMTAITAQASGIVAAILVEDGATVDAGAALVELRA